MPYIFLYVSDLARARRFYEGALALPVAETDASSVKYDCRSVMLALNVLSAPPDSGSLIVLAVADIEDRWRRLQSHGIEPAEAGPGRSQGSHTFTDPDGHRLRITRMEDTAGPRPGTQGQGLPADKAQPGGQARDFLSVTDVLLPAPDLPASQAYYSKALGLSEAASPEPELVSYDAGRFRLSVYAAPAPGRGSTVPPASYVFHADDCEHERSVLQGHGVEMSGLNAGDIGVTAQFRDPAGHDFYLYQPSPEALSWPSGPVYRRIIGAEEHAR
jgi:predicted enzyme related to lactoylglutathione lyase